MIYKAKSFCLLSFTRHAKFTGCFLDEHPEYKIVHYHRYIDAAIDLTAARRHGRIALMHAHVGKVPIVSFRTLVRRGVTHMQRYSADYFLACSTRVGIGQFGSKAGFKVIPNGIETSRYTFNSETRSAIRSRRGIPSESTIVLGHVGRFESEKNHRLIVDVFKEVHDVVPDSRLWLIGAGSLEDDVRSQVHELGLDEAVDFVGLVSNVNEYLMGMDVFMFPSLYEGLGISLIEAEASGLPCVISDAVPSEAVVSDRVTRMNTCPPPST